MAATRSARSGRRPVVGRSLFPGEGDALRSPAPEPDLDPVREPAPAAPPPLFDPATWYYDPVSRKGLPYDGMRSCSCGGTRFLFVTRGASDRDHGVYCEACYHGPFKHRLWRKQDLVYATLDTRTRIVTPTRDLADVVALRARMPKS